MKGTLYLIPTTLGETEIEKVIPKVPTLQFDYKQAFRTRIRVGKHRTTDNV